MSVTLSTLQLWTLQCKWHCQPCKYGCSSVSDTAKPADMDAPVPLTLSTLQLWMLQCQWHSHSYRYGCSSITNTVKHAAMVAPVSVTLSTLHIWMPQYQWHCQPCRYVTTDAPVLLGVSTLQQRVLQYQWKCSSVSDTVNHVSMDVTNTHKITLVFMPFIMSYLSFYCTKLLIIHHTPTINSTVTHTTLYKI